MKKKMFRALVILLALLAAPVSASAAFQFVADASVTGNGAAATDGFNITVDTDTGLEWLDVTLSAGFSYDYVSSQFGTGGLFEGFRYATVSEMLTFWTNGGVVPVPYVSPIDGPGVENMISVWGRTEQNFPVLATRALTADTNGFGTRIMGQLFILSRIGDSPGVWEGIQTAALAADAVALPDVGSALVRTVGQIDVVPVPEPSGLAAWGAAAVGLFVVRHRSSRRQAL